MPRLKKEEVATREAFLIEVLNTDSTLSVRQLQERIVQKFGKQMRPSRILEIRNDVRSKLPVVIHVGAVDVQPTV